MPEIPIDLNNVKDYRQRQSLRRPLTPAEREEVEQDIAFLASVKFDVNFGDDQSNDIYLSCAAWYAADGMLSDKQIAWLRANAIRYSRFEYKRGTFRGSRPRQPQDQQQTEPKLNLNQEMIRKMISLCHPDKHNNSETSTEVTRYLLNLKKENED